MSMNEISHVPSDDDLSQPETYEETVEVNGFQVLASNENRVREMFDKHPDLTSNFDLKNQHLRNAYMDILLDVNETLCNSTEKLLWEDLNKAYSSLIDLTKAGLKLGWLHEQLYEGYMASVRNLAEMAKKKKLILSKLESDLEKKKDAAQAIRT